MSPASLLITLLSSTSAQDDPVPFEVPSGFEISLYADDDLVHDCYSLTIDSHGRVVVAGPGYVKTLHDEDGDGRADAATLFSDRPRAGAKGMVFDGPHLFCTGDGALMLLRDDDGDGRADGEPEVWAKLRNPEHGANGLRIGPDGKVYLICGNDSGLSAEHLGVEYSPVPAPSMGGLLRFGRDRQDFEVLAHGFRNPYDFDFHPDGAILVVDADGERDQHLPWYSPTRLFDVAIGGHHGWVIQGWRRSWNRPEHFHDNVDRAAEFGRGSPTGVLCVRHHAWPERYRRGVFSVCWTLGTVWYCPLARDGAALRGRAETFVRTRGHVGFAPVDLELGPDGSMFVAIGGRGTRGGVFRIRPPRDAPPPAAPEVGLAEELRDVLDADQPLQAWSRARWVPLARELGRAAFAEAARDEHLGSRRRIRAIEVLVEVFGGLRSIDLGQLARIDEPSLAARATWGMAQGVQRADDPRLDTLLLATGLDEPQVQRAAWEALLQLSCLDRARLSEASWLTAAGSQDRRVRLAARTLALRHDFTPDAVSDRPIPLAMSHFGALLAAERGEDLFAADPSSGGDASHLDTLRRAVLAAAREPATAATAARALEAVRALQLAIGDVELDAVDRESDTGYVARPGSDGERRLIGALAFLEEAFPTGAEPLDSELARLIAMRGEGSGDFLEGLADRASASRSPTADVHDLLIAAQVPAPRSDRVRGVIADTLLRLHEKLERHQLHPSRNWPLRVGECFERLVQLDPRLGPTLVEQPDFGRVEHTLFAERLRGEARERAVRRLFERARTRPMDEGWSRALVRLLRELPAAGTVEELRRRFGEPGLRDEIALSLARLEDPEDARRLTRALSSTDAKVVRTAAAALRALPRPGAGRPDYAACLRALRRFSADDAVQAALAELVRHWSGRPFDGLGDPAFLAWLETEDPEQLARFAGFTPAQRDAWALRLQTVDFGAGDAERGRRLYVDRACADCHDGSRRLGPHLKNVTRRFDHLDLFASIVRPSDQISPLYQASQVVTVDGQVFVGVPVYQSPDGTILETRPGELVRFTDSQIASRQPTSRSPMPEDLLDGLSDGQLADLWVYLDTLR